MAEQDRQISNTIERERSRLRGFIRRRVTDPSDAEDIMQDVFSELVEAYRLLKPIEQVTAWLYRVARNRITDLFRSRKREVPGEAAPHSDDDDDVPWEELLISPDAGPEAAYARSVVLEELEEAIEELPAEQREVFIAHEIEGRSFKELSAESGVSVNTLLSRKHYAVLHLRERLGQIYKDFKE